MVTLIIPAYNEEAAVGETVRTARDALTGAGVAYEIIVVDDGSTDGTADVAREEGALVISHSHNIGYGASLKTGIWRAQHDWIAITDADGTYPVDEFPALLKATSDFDMVVGSRTGKEYWGQLPKRIARRILLWLGEIVTGTYIPDINSGMRIFKKEIVLRNMDRISNGFSFTTTITLAMILEGRFIKFVPITYHPRIGSSHVRYWRDIFRVGQIIVQAMLYANPLKMFSIFGLTLILLAFFFYTIARFFPSFSFTPPFLGLALFITGIQSIFFGILADLVLKKK